MRAPSILVSLALFACSQDDTAEQKVSASVSEGALTVDDDGDGYTENDGDCDDTNATVFPGNSERCDGVDNDCDGATDEDVLMMWYIDSDGDGYGSTSSVFPHCSAPPMFVDNADDCNDGNASANPGETEVCDTVDNDCDGSTDEGVTSTFYADADGDGFGDAAVTTAACAEGSGYVADSTDCDDTEAAAYPGNTEICDGIDNDCDAVTDQVDDDGDTYIAAECGGTDCDDADITVNPGATEVWYDGIDADCSGGSDYDYDGDGFDSTDYAGTDCDDNDASISPGATEIWYDGVDQDCDAADDYDQDGDGYLADSQGGDDCDDTVASTYPGASDAWYDGVDSDCAGNSDYDQDGDGYDADGYAGTDCDDTVATVHPDATEVAEDGIDNNCDDSPYGAGAWVDVSVSDADVIFSGEAAGDRAGQGDPGMDAAGDVNGDGIDDIIVGALRDSTAATYAGAAYIIHGPVTADMSLGSADAKMTGEAASDFFGARIAGIGNINNDGYDDVMVGAVTEDSAGSNAGAAYLFLGPISGTMSASSADVKILGTGAGAVFGEVAWVGDVSGDGTDDFMVSSQFADDASESAGAVYLFHGPLTSGTLSATTADAILTGENTLDEAGSANWGAGDVNGDGVNDVIVGARNNDDGGSNAGAAYLVYGPITSDLGLASADAQFTGEEAEAQIGWGVSVSTAGDMDADGYDDVVIGAKFDNDAGTWAGAAYIINGPPSSGTTSLANADGKLLGEAERDYTGDAVHGPGDIDGDGFDDVVIGSGYNEAGAENGGSVYLVRGPFSGTESLTTAAEARFSAAGADDRLRGHGVGDIDNDGLMDILVSAQLNDDAGTDAGALYLFYGSGL